MTSHSNMSAVSAEGVEGQDDACAPQCFSRRDCNNESFGCGRFFTPMPRRRWACASGEEAPQLQREQRRKQHADPAEQPALASLRLRQPGQLGLRVGVVLVGRQGLMHQAR